MYINHFRKGALFIAGFFMLFIAGWAQEVQPVPPPTPTLGIFDLIERAAYFPLEVGNEWVYSDGRSQFKVQVLKESQEANRHRYFEIAGYFQYDTVKTRKVRSDLLGQVHEFNPRGNEYLWYRLLPITGLSWVFETSADLSCIPGSSVKVASIKEALNVPAGSFTQVMRLDFIPSKCADGGISREYFARGVGLIRRVMNTIAGPLNIDLVSAKVGSTQIPLGGYGVEIASDRPVYYNNYMPPIVDPAPTLKAQLTVRNETEIPVEFIFATSQRFDFIVRDPLGKEVLRWSAGRNFLQALGHETLVKGKLTYNADLVLKGKDGKPLPEGFYQLEGVLTTVGWNAGLLATQGSVYFQIKNVH